MCGGAGQGAQQTGPAQGRSPRVRGSRINRRLRIGVRGSIPACAGEPCSIGLNSNAFRVDPRVCGGACSSACKILILLGRSPRVRGSLIVSKNAQTADGSIPACAGEPQNHKSLVPTQKVDPRVCGGAAMGIDWMVRDEGRSPRVRGSPHIHGGGNDRARSIPACAGEPA